jgi:hypothetical protein
LTHVAYGGYDDYPELSERTIRGKLVSYARERYKWRSAFLFPLPSAISGIARILDLGGTYTACNRSATPEETDWKALFSDWAITGQDLISAAREINGKQK